MDKYLEAEKRLAELLGWRQTQTRCEGEACWATDLDPDCDEVRFANWCRDDAAAFRLMVEHGVIVYPFENLFCTVSSVAEDFVLNERYAKHSDKATAVRFAIVQAVIAKLSN